MLWRRDAQVAEDDLPHDGSPVQALLGIVRSAVPDNVVAAAAGMNVLGVITFSLFFGACLAALGEQAEGLVRLIHVRPPTLPYRNHRSCEGPRTYTRVPAPHTTLPCMPLFLLSAGDLPSLPVANSVASDVTRACAADLQCGDWEDGDRRAVDVPGRHRVAHRGRRLPRVQPAGHAQRPGRHPARGMRFSCRMAQQEPPGCPAHTPCTVLLYSGRPSRKARSLVRLVLHVQHPRLPTGSTALACAGPVGVHGAGGARAV